MNSKTLSNIFKGDKVIWMVFFFLCVISVVEVFSASSELTYKGGNYMTPILRHIGLLILGIASMVVTLNIQCKYFKIITPFLLLGSILMLLIVLLTGSATNGASRWIGVMGFQFQPSEFAKGAMILATAQILSAMQTENGADKNALKYILFICIIVIPLILVENFSTAALLSVVIFMMMIIGRIPARQLGKRMDTWKSRINKFLNHKEVAPEDVDLNKDAQVAHANIAIATSNGYGKGPGNSVERDFLSQAFSDFIFAIIIEEMGIEGAIFVALLYIILLFRTGKIASRCENNFPALLAMGLALLLVTQALFNMCVAVGLAPVTGQPLPLVSRGGTSTIINCIYIGVILSISRSAKKKPSNDDLAKKTTPSMAIAK